MAKIRSTKTTGKTFRETAQQLRVEIGAGKQAGAERVEQGGAHPGALGHGGDQGRAELRFVEQAYCTRDLAQGADAGADAGDPGRAGGAGIAQRDGAGGLDGEAVPEIVEGVVEDDEGTAPDRGEPGVDRGRQRVEFGPAGLGIGPIQRPPRRVGLAQGGGDGAEPELGVFRVEPEMGVGLVLTGRGEFEVGDLDLLQLGLAGELQDLHAVTLGLGYGVQHVRRADKHDVREVVLNVEVVIQERVVLFGIQDLEQRG